MKLKSESEVTQSCPTFSDPMDCSPPGSSIHEIFQARVLEWGAIAFSWTVVISIFKHQYHGFNYFVGSLLVFFLGVRYFLKVVKILQIFS